MLRSIHGEAREDDLAIVERSAGVPLYLEALASDVLPKARSGLGIADIPPPPADLFSILNATVSIGRLYLDVLQAAAVIGEAFTQDCILALLPGKTAAEFAEASAFLTKHRIWERRQGGIVFRHMLVRDAVYDGTPASRRKRLHAAAAEYFSAMEQEADPAYLGWHYLHADVPVAAVQWLWAAAKRSFALGWTAQSAALYREVIQFMLRSPVAAKTGWPGRADLAEALSLLDGEADLPADLQRRLDALLEILPATADRRDSGNAERRR